MTPTDARALAARLVMVDLPGATLDAGTEALWAEFPVRAVCLFRRNMPDEAATRALTAALRTRLGALALLAVDQEGGPVSRAAFVPVAPPAMALGAVGTEAAARQAGAAVARSVRHLGLNWNFAPVLDVNNNPANPVIAERSFGDTPDDVARLAAAWMQGSLDAGVATCVKHFPGHGDTHQDSHHTLPTVDKTLAELEALELRPFRAVLPHAPAAMTAHIVYPRLDAELPATLSRPWLTGVLRESLRFDGVVVTDALMMEAVRARWGHANAAVLALQAGADLVLAQGSLDEQRASLQAIADALADGRIPLEQARASAARVDALATRFSLAEAPYAAGQREADAAAMAELWARSLCALRGAVPPQGPLRVIAQRQVAGTGVSEAGLDDAGVQSLFDPQADIVWQWVTSLQDLAPDAIPRDGRCNVLVSTPRRRLPPQASRWPIDLALLLWNPFQALDLSAPALISWGYHPTALAAVRDWLGGRRPAAGRPPVAALRQCG